MDVTRHSTELQYRAAIFCPGGCDVLVCDTAEGDVLPMVSVPIEERPAKWITEELREQYGVSSFIVGYIPLDEGTLVVAEELGGHRDKTLSSIPFEELDEGHIPAYAREQILLLQRGESLSSGGLSRFGWIQEAVAWVEGATGQRVTDIASIRQFSAEGAYALILFPLDDGSFIWLKATGEPNRHERAVTSVLASLLPLSTDREGYIPKVIGERAEWNAWIMQGGRLPLAHRLRSSAETAGALEAAVTSLARLQITATKQTANLLAAGAFDQRWETIRNDSVELFAYLEEAMSLQRSTRAPVLSRQRIHELHGVFLNLSAHAENLGIPASVLHGDLNYGNVLFGEPCQFIDWAEAYVGCPVASLEHLLAWNQSEDMHERLLLNRRLRGLYRNEWVEFGGYTAQDLDELLRIGRAVAPISALYGRGCWLVDEEKDRQGRRSFSRTVARAFDRAVRALSEQEVPCV